MSKHRKIFNLFKFIDEVNSMNKIVTNKKYPLYLKVLVFLSHLGSFFYFIFDNFLWLCHSNISRLFFTSSKLLHRRKTGLLQVREGFGLSLENQFQSHDQLSVHQAILEDEERDNIQAHIHGGCADRSRVGC